MCCVLGEGRGVGECQIIMCCWDMWPCERGILIKGYVAIISAFSTHLDGQFSESWYSVVEAIGDVGVDLVIDCSWQQVVNEVLKLQ